MSATDGTTPHSSTQHHARAAAAPVPLDELEAALRDAVRGEVRFSIGDRALYATDSSNYRQLPHGVVVPETVDDVVETVRICSRLGVPLLSRGGGTSLAGQTCNTALILDFSKNLNRVLEIDPQQRRARVEPGCVLDALRRESEQFNLTFGPDPATHESNTLGGMIGNNSCGPHSIMSRRTADNVQALDIVTIDGVRMSVGPTPDEQFAAIVAGGERRPQIYRQLDEFRNTYADLLRTRYPDIPRRVSGYADLDQLLPENGFNVAKALVGTEGTCVTVLSATLDLSRSPPERALVLVSCPDVFRAADLVPDVRNHGPMAIEGIDEFLVAGACRKGLFMDEVKRLPEGGAWLVVEFGGDTGQEARAKAEKLAADVRDGSGIVAEVISDPADQASVWNVREAALPGSVYVPGRADNWEGWEDSAVAPEHLGAYLRDLRALFEKYGYESPMYGHFGDGLVHCRISFDQTTKAGVAKWRDFTDEATDLVVSYGGSISGEHGDGQARADHLERMYGPEMIDAFRAFKAIWDPANLMNPGKVIDPYPMTANLRHGPAVKPPEPETAFAYRLEGGFVGAAERCVGVGKCRRLGSEDGVMCPSYMVTREEKHSTRGRARLLFEILHGDAIKDGWKSDAVEEALNLCLACKGCKSDCPVNVDMATYKAEFRSHYYAGRIRPRSAYSLGLIHWWARAAAWAPWLVNAATQTRGLSRLAKAIGGIHPDRDIPRFASRTFRSWFKRRRDRPGDGDGERIMLWPDTFNNHLRPDTLIAATRVLESAGYTVVIPARPICCGRPLYAEGMLQTAKSLWRRTFDALDEEITRGTPIVGLEPACVAAFKDELLNLFPDDRRANRLAAQTTYFADFVVENAERFAALDGAPSGERALVQVHCNHHAVLKDAGERALLDRLGIDYTIAPSGCCGMAGAFGLAAETADVAQACGERVILPMVRDQDRDVAILADGYSCREQIEQGTDRETVHIAELMARRIG